MTEQLADSPLLRRHAPYTISGYRLFRELTDTDGAIPAAIKALMIAVAAVARNRDDLARRELARGKGLGLEIGQAVAGLIVLSSLRGEGAAQAFERLLEAVYGPTEPAAPVAQVPVAEGEARHNFETYFGQIPVPLQVMLDLVPRGADAYYLMRRGSIDANPLSPKHGEFLLLTILAADYSPMTATHVRGARNAGATDEEIAEAFLCAIPAGGIAAWMAAAPFLAAS
ncbi:MAG: carboxymuconolactone decarboxylase family protein [Sphingomonadales bacterium]|nr:carboxymuconolactone decarboxylase family protein [Sphingomonadales bacterium]